MGEREGGRGGKEKRGEGEEEKGEGKKVNSNTSFPVKSP